MNNEKFKMCTIDTISLVKDLARKAKMAVDNTEKGLNDYAEGMIMGYYTIITFLKHEAFAFCISQKELGLADIEPERDLFDLHSNPDMNFGEDNWKIDVMSEDRLKGYLNDWINLLKEQALEAKREADSPKEGFEEYNKGEYMAYHSVFALLRRQASIFNINEKELDLP